MLVGLKRLVFGKSVVDAEERLEKQINATKQIFNDTETIVGIYKTKNRERVAEARKRLADEQSKRESMPSGLKEFTIKAYENDKNLYKYSTWDPCVNESVKLYRDLMRKVEEEKCESTVLNSKPQAGIHFKHDRGEWRE